MNGDHFEELFEKMCVAAAEKLGPSTFVLDNASYHKRVSDERQTLGYWSKLPASEVRSAWEGGHVPGQEQHHGAPLTTKKAILAFLRDHPPRSTPRVKDLAAKHGHVVIFLPPYRPELNAIEQAWAVTKNFVARNNSPSVTFADLLGVIERGFKEVTLSTWTSLDQKVMKTEKHQLATLAEERRRLDEFRRAHPDLAFEVGASSSSSSEEDSSDSDAGSEDGEEEVLQHLRDGLEVSDAVEVPEPQDSLDREELEAAATLLTFMEE